MFKTLILRNAKRSAKDYLIYIGTMTIISTLMFAFHGMIFSKDMWALYQDMTAFGVLIGAASFFIIWIVVWLVRYIVSFMLEKRSKEFGTYLLLGMTKKQIISLFRRENYLLGLLCIVLGIIPGYLFQLLFVNVFYSILETELRLSPDFNPWYLLLTVGILGVAYLLAFGSAKRRIQKMTIRDLLYTDQKNEQVAHEKNSRKGILVLFAVAYIVLFNYLVLSSSMSLRGSLFYAFGLVIAIYALYFGLSAFFVRFIQSKFALIYKKERLFVLRQLSSKIKTMRFTMGTLTVLFTGALLSWMVVMMFADFQRTQISQEMPFDLLLYSQEPNDSFDEKLAVIEEDAEFNQQYIYNIYENQTTTMNDYLYEHVDGTKKSQPVGDRWSSGTYFAYDTYMGLSDYNHLREMLGYEPVELEAGNYLIHGKKRLEKQWQQAEKEVPIQIDNQIVSLQTVRMEPFCQNGPNGADYLIVVPDSEVASLTPYYSVLAADLAHEAPNGLLQRLEALDTSLVDTEDDGELYNRPYGLGSDQIGVASGTVIVKDNMAKESIFVIASLCFMMAYLGIVFLCAALTILAIQQLSDSTKHKKRYEILNQLGLSKKETKKVVFKQLSIYYLCPLIISVGLSAAIGFFAGERFVYFTGVESSPVGFYGLSVLCFLVVYTTYFIVTYIGFTRNIEKH